MADGQAEGESRVLLDMIMAERDYLREHHSQWWFDYEDFDPLTASREVCETLLASAPTDWARGMMAGVIVTRNDLALVTGRGF